MTDSPLHIAFLWHMHQPFYKDPQTGSYRLPWVRLHGTKDYLDMLKIQLEFPEMRQTFNYTPSLLEQLIDYTHNNAQDRYLELTLKNASDLDTNDRIFLLENFFLANWDNMIRPFARYHELLMKRGMRLIRSDLARTINYFSRNDFLDLQVLFNLSWIDPLFRQQDQFLASLVEKGKDFSEEDKNLLVSRQLDILKQIIPAYAEALGKGQIELSVSPFYHPILPLLCDTNSARIALPDIRLPQRRFAHPEDALKQIRMGLDFFEKTVGVRPSGMWPSEGSVSPEVLKLVAQEGIKWIGTDEDILSISLEKQLRDSSRNLLAPDILYKPYQYENVSVIFRDHELSDLIGFVYSKWDPQKAADDLIARFLRIRSSVPGHTPHLVSVILDGENAWEYYRNDGSDFLRHLYDGLSREKRLKMTTVSEFLREFGPGDPLLKLHTGSWIYANFGIWIGHEEDNTAWDYLTETRHELSAFENAYPATDISVAWKSLYIAEGSDWNWWYGDEHTTETQKDFDELFRMNLMNVYTTLGKEIPPHLFIPVLREDRSVSPSVAIRGFIEPRIDGLVTSYYEWYQGARVETRKSGGSMHKSESILSVLYYGFNKDTLFLRLDPAIPFHEFPDGTKISLHLLKQSQMKIEVSFKPELRAEFFLKTDSEWKKRKDIADIAVQDVFEIGIPFSDLDAREKEEISLHISVMKNGEEIERCPWRGHITIPVPTSDFEAMLWY